MERCVVGHVLLLSFILGISASSSSDPYLVIANGSIPCETYKTAMHLLGQSEPYLLTDDDKMQLFRDLGGQINSALQAVTVEASIENFGNLLPISISEISTLAKYYKESMSSKDSIKRALQVYYEALSESLKTSDGKSTDTVLSDKEHITLGILSEEEADRFGPIREGTISEVVDYCLYRGSKLPFNEELLRLCTVCSVTRVMNANFFPRIVNEARCQGDNPVCLVGDLYEDLRPQVIHGGCIDTHMTLNILRQEPGRCILALANGQVVVAENWEIVNDVIKVGCECAVKRDSMLARYA